MSIPTDTQEKVQTLKEQLAGARTLKKRLELLMQLGEELWLSAPDQARPFLEQILEETNQSENPSTIARTANMLAEINRRAGKLDESARYAEQVLKVARATGDPRVEADAVNLAGVLCEEQGNYDQARENYEQCLNLSREAGYLEGKQAALNQLGGLFGLQGQPQQALDCYQQCLEVDKQQGDNYGQALSSYNIGWVLEQMGKWEQSSKYLYRTIALSEQHGFRDLRLDATNMLGELCLKRNKLGEATDMFSAVIKVEQKQPGYQQSLLDALCGLGVAHSRAGNLAATEKAYTEAVQLCKQAGDRRHLGILFWRMAELALAQGQLNKSKELLNQASELAAELGLQREKGEVLRVQALLHAEQNDISGAQDCFEQATAAFADTGDSYELAQTRLQHGRLLMNAGQPDSAMPLLKAATQTFHRLSVVAESEQANELLFLLEVRTDRDTALLDGLTRLAGIGLEPVSFFDHMLQLLGKSLEAESGVVLLEELPVVLYKRPDLNAAKVLGRRRNLVVTATAICFPVRSEGKVLGSVYLEHRKPGGPQPNPEVLEKVAGLLADPLTKLAELPLRFGPEPEIAGLQYQGIIGSNPLMVENLKVVSKVASAKVPVLVRGESGTGKELVARALHESGVRRDKPFVAVNCAAVPETLLEPEFFGVEKGTATGVAQRKGKFEQAHRGTIFLDEIGDMSHALQARLLRVLQEETFERVGGVKPVQVDVRIVAATNKNLDELMRQGKFRADLFYRLNTVDLLLPPLRERKEDIPGFVRYFITRSNQEFGRNILGAGHEVMGRFLTYHWPGNVRQLRHVVERAVILAQKQVLETGDLPLELQRLQPALKSESASGLRKARRVARAQAAAQAQRTMLIDCLEKAGWNTDKAAALAGYSRAHLYRLMRKYNIPRSR